MVPRPSATVSSPTSPGSPANSFPGSTCAASPAPFSQRPGISDPSTGQSKASAIQPAAGDQLRRDHVALDLVGALADDHQRRVPEVALHVVLGRVAVAAA